MTMIIAIGVAAVLAAAAFIVISMSQADQGGATDTLYPQVEVSDDGTFSLVDGGEIEPGAVYQWRRTDGGFVIGNPNAPVTIVEFADFLCPACQGYKPEIDRFIREYVLTGQAQFEYRMILTQQNSQVVAQVAECAAEMYEGGFYPVYEELFRIAQSRFVDASVGRDIARSFDLDYAVMLECMAEADQFTVDARLGQGQNPAISSTPTMRVRYGDGPLQVIGGIPSGGVPFDALAQAVLVAQF
ncbi:thioredoxin domain-containing protein [bacterium]|nr:thioredoxin domain-containing protein [bacterium]